ncbi:armadillo-type protein [Corynascus similis CBS 632.67]
MATRSPLSQRTEFFQQLKKVCVPLSQLALSRKDKVVDSKEVLRLLDSLINLWTAQANEDASILDDKLADYVFFPLSHVLKGRDRYSMRVIEAVIRLLRLLVQHGWKAKASPQLFQQLLIFLTFVIGGVPGQPKKEVPEETIVEGFRTLTALVSIAEPSHLTTQSAESASRNETIPALELSVTVMLEGITDGPIPAIQLEAVQCLRAIFTTIRNHAVLAQILPGTVSALTKVLSPPQANQTQRRVLLESLDVLKLVLVNVLGDIRVRSLLKELQASSKSDPDATAEQKNPAAPAVLTSSWLRATVSQLKIALSAVLKLRAHESEQIQSALHRFCIALLDECHSSLADCQTILVETAVMLEDPETTQSHLQTSLQDLAGVYPKLGDGIKSALYNWITGLPRVMQSSDERVRQLAIRSILRGSKLAAALHMDSSTLDDALGDSLRDSIITLIKSSKQPKIVDDAGADLPASGDLVTSGTELAAYRPVLLDLEGQKNTRKEIHSLISNLGSAVQQVKVATTMLGYLRDSEGVEQIASFWLSFELLKATYAQSSDVDELLDLSSLGESRHQEDAFRELYDFSASVLAAHSDSIETDWQLEAIALEVTAFAASRLKSDFRPELIDVLYPVTTFLGSRVPQLRAHSITTLNVIAASCGYESVSDLIVDNADYMVNSISLRLNTFDISPASTRVFAMVIRLTGPRLLPFLDDIVAAIFAALENYHGYPVFVESLFSVLTEVVTQGVKSDTLLLEDGNTKPVNHRKQPPKSPGIPGILQTLTAGLERAERSTREEAEAHTIPHPKQPWGTPKDQASSLLDKLTNPDADDEVDADADRTSTEDKEKDRDKPKTPTYALVAQIFSLTQHHLTSPAPALRRSLLDLVAKAGRALAPDEDVFLPLVNAVWPVALARLRDREPYVAAAACRALAALCEGAGDFLASRFRSEWFSGTGSSSAALSAWFWRAREEAAAARKSKRAVNSKIGGASLSFAGGGGARKGIGMTGDREGILVPTREGVVGNGDGMRLVETSSSFPSGSGGALGRFAQASQVWEAAVELLTAIVAHVRLEDDMFDDILELVVDVLPQHGELREALEIVNADAVWLALYERGMGQERAPPVAEGFDFQFATLGRGGTVKVGD